MRQTTNKTPNQTTTAADPEPPSDAAAPPASGGRALWRHGRDGHFKLIGNSPPVSPGSTPPKEWTFAASCQAGACSAMCWERTGYYDAGRCGDSSSGRRFCRCWRSGGAVSSSSAAAAAQPPAPPKSL